MGESKNDYTIHSVQKALMILRLFSQASNRMTLSEISERIGLGKSSTLRLLYTLVEADFLNCDPKTKEYSLGIVIFELGTVKYNSINWRETAVKHLQALSNDAGLLCYLGIREKDQMVMLEKIFPRSVPTWTQLLLQPGAASALYSTGIGRLFLAQLSDEELDAYIARTKIEKITELTITDEKRLRDMIRDCRVTGVGHNTGENESYISSICAPIYNHQGKMIAGISLCGMSDMLCGDLRPAFTEKVRSIARTISAEIGYKGYA